MTVCAARTAETRTRAERRREAAGQSVLQLMSAESDIPADPRVDMDNTIIFDFIVMETGFQRENTRNHEYSFNNKI